MKIIIAAILAVVFLSISAIHAEEKDMQKLDVNLGFEQVPDENTCEGKNISPMMEIRGLNATSMAVILVDPDAPSGLFTHWIIWNVKPLEIIPEAIPASATVTDPISAVQGKNSFGKIGYLGPCPPPGTPHRYLFSVYGLDKMLDLQPGASRQDLEKAMEGHILQKGEAMATYGR
jgi:Raf kinase inhibitor-like YbhB/YbcL family protein